MLASRPQLSKSWKPFRLGSQSSGTSSMSSVSSDQSDHSGMIVLHIYQQGRFGDHRQITGDDKSSTLSVMLPHRIHTRDNREITRYYLNRINTCAANTLSAELHTGSESGPLICTLNRSQSRGYDGLAPGVDGTTYIMMSNSRTLTLPRLRKTTLELRERKDLKAHAFIGPDSRLYRWKIINGFPARDSWHVRA